MKTHAVKSLFYGDLILQQKWSHMRAGLKRGKYFFVKCKINIKKNTHITKQIESLNYLACLNIKIIYLTYTVTA